VENMIPLSARRQFAAVLKAGRLDGIPSSFRDPAYFDEVPLYSRYAQVDFLKQYGDVDRLLLELSLEYMNRVISERTATQQKRFVAVAIIRDSDEFIVPHIFICNGNARARLKDLHLSLPSAGLGKNIESLLRQIDKSRQYGTLEDRTTREDDVRVFVSYKSPPQGMISLEEFRNSAGL
jgi:hypothetical protein